MYKTNELDINHYVGLAKSHVGEIRDLEFQSYTKWGEAAGKYEILEFVEENPHFTYSYWKYEQDDTPSGAKLGYYRVKITESKFYNGKTIRVPVHAYVQETYNGKNYGRKTKALCINNENLDTGKRLKAYEFGIIDFREYE